MDTRNRRVVESRDGPSQTMNRVSSSQNEYTNYVNAREEICVPEYFNLPNLIRVSNNQQIPLVDWRRVSYLKVTQRP